MIKLEHIKKNFTLKDKRVVEVLKDINVTFPSSSMSFIVGYSGSGKTTLLDIIGCLLTPDSGEVYIDDRKIDYSSSKSLNEIRSKLISFVFQDFNLLEDFTIEDNLVIAGLTDLNKVDELLKKVGLYEKKGTEVKYLSGGEKQRLAIARALGRNTDVILLDEPTGSLDKKNTKQVMELLKEISKEKTIVVVTHEEHLVEEYGDFACEIDDGVVSVLFDKRKDDNFGISKIKSESREAKFDFKHAFKYSFTLLKTRLLNNIMTCVSLCICLFLAITSLSFLTFNRDNLLYEALVSENKYQLSPYRGYNSQISAGLNVKADLDNADLEYYPYYIDDSTISNFSFKVNVVSGEFKFQNQIYEEPGYGDIYLTSYLNSRYTSEFSTAFSLNGLLPNSRGYKIDLNISKTISTPLNRDITAKLAKGESLNEYEKQMFKDVYCNAFISKQTYDYIFDYIGELAFANYSGSIKVLTSENPSVTLSANTVKKISEDNALLYGKNPVGYNEFAISKSVFDNLASLVENITYESVVGINFNEFSDRFTSFVFGDSYEQYISLNDVLNGPCELVGVYEDEDAALYFSDEFMEDLFNTYLDFLSGFTTVISSSKDIASLVDLGYLLQTKTINQVLTIDQFITQDLLLIFSIFIGILLIVFVVIMLLSASVMVNSKAKELSIMKSIGIKTPSIHVSFMLKNAFMGLFSFVIGVVFSIITIPIVDSKILEVLNISASITPIHFSFGYSILMLVASLAIAVLGSLLPLLKLKKLDLATELKEC